MRNLLSNPILSLVARPSLAASALVLGLVVGLTGTRGVAAPAPVAFVEAELAPLSAPQNPTQSKGLLTQGGGLRRGMTFQGGGSNKGFTGQHDPGLVITTGRPTNASGILPHP
ncbi:MAG: hypothetical protein RL562_1685 [Planctomycetota bacterium]|jgi:hypothetical protein